MIIFYFLLGLIGVPILSGFVDLVLTFFEFLKSFMGKKIMQNNECLEEEKPHAIGFQYTPPSEEEEYFEEDV